MKKALALALIVAALATMVIVPVSAEMTAEESAKYDAEKVYCPNCSEVIGTWGQYKENVAAGNRDANCDNCGSVILPEPWFCGYCNFCLQKKPGDICPNCHAGTECNIDLDEGYDNLSSWYEGTIYGYEKGLIAANSEGYNAGYEAGYAAGKAEGNSGSDGDNGNYDSSDAYQAGLEAGRKQVLEELEATATTNKYYKAGVTAGYNSGYSAGYNAGEKAGYNKGYKAGYDAAFKQTSDKYQFGCFAFCTFNAVLGISIDGQSTQKYRLENIDMSFGFGYVYIGANAVKQIDDYYKSITGNTGNAELEGIDYIELECVFNDSFDFRSQPMYITGDSDIMDLTIYSVSGDVASCGYEYKTSGAFSQFKLPDSWIGPFHCKKAVLYIGRPVDLLQAFSLYSPSGQFYTGYDVGYAEGARESASEARAEGYKNGYQQGLAKGNTISKDGTFYSLISAVIDVPINTFSSMLNFEILGVNMKAFVTSILTLLLMIIIIKKLI